MSKLAGNLTNLGLLLLGLVLAATPLALWVALSEIIFLAVLAAGTTAGVLFCVLAHWEEPASPAQGEASDRVRVGIGLAGSIGELQGLHPFIHHHRASGGPKFQRVMRRLKTDLY